MRKTELVMRRKNVKAFIEADPIRNLVVTRATEATKTAAGGYLAGVKQTLPPQDKVFRIVQNVRRYDPGNINSEAGDVTDSRYNIVGIYTGDLQKDDEFYWQNELYRVKGIQGNRIESIFAGIELMGKPNRDAS